MGRIRRALIAALIGGAAILAFPSLGSAQLVTADINGDGVGDHIGTGSAPVELVIRLSNAFPSQRLRTGKRIIDVVVADFDRDGDSDLLVLLAGTRHLALRIWTNVGRGRFLPHPRDALAKHRPARRRLITPERLSPDDEVYGDVSAPFIVASAGVTGRAVASVPLPLTGTPCPSWARFSRRTPRGPPALLFS